MNDMSILIKGMEMPKETYAHCMLVKDINGSVQLHVCTKNSEEVSEWEYYDLVPVPPHGRLGDLDALIDKVIAKYLNFERKGELVFAAAEIKQDICDLISDAPTIIPAEDGE